MHVKIVLPTAFVVVIVMMIVFMVGSLRRRSRRNGYLTAIMQQLALHMNTVCRGKLFEFVLHSHPELMDVEFSALLHDLEEADCIVFDGDLLVLTQKGLSALDHFKAGNARVAFNLIYGYHRDTTPIW